VKSLIKSQLTVLPEVACVPFVALHIFFKGVSVTRQFALFLFMACVLDGRTSNLQRASQRANKLCGKDHPTQKTSSIYTSFKRLFQNGKVDTIIQGLFCIVVSCLHHFSGPLELVMDRTHWEFRGNVKNVLVIGCIYQGIFIPLVFTDLGHKGNSNFKERKELIERFLKYWALTNLSLPPIFLAGDREFIGAEWWAYLIEKNIQFAFRIKEGQAFYIWMNNNISDTKFKVNLLRKALDKPELTHQEIVVLEGYILDLFICKNVTPKATEKYVYIVTNFKIPENAPDFYRKRWTIEVCFKHLKSNGFDLESTGLDGEHKIELLFSIISCVYTICVIRGILTEIQHKPKSKTFAVEDVKKDYKQTSTFTLGYTISMEIIYDVFDFILNLHDTVFSNSSLSTKYAILKNSVQ
jgi:hypothetical protein